MKQLRFIPVLSALLIFIIPGPARASDGLEWVGPIDSRPAGNQGTWIINGMSFESTSSTQFNVEHGSLTVGACAKMDYYTSGGVNYAYEIESEAVYKCGGGNDDNDGASYKVYGAISSFPPAPYVGNWVIGGITYTADTGTHLEQSDGPFQTGACVEVKYVAGSNKALEVETAGSYKCTANGGTTPGTSYSQMYGVLDAFPAGLAGTWTISGTTYTSNATTRFEQEEGPFFVGGCVEVKYQAGTTTAVEISAENAYKCSGGSSRIESKFYGVLTGTIPAGPTYIGNWTISGGAFTSNTPLVPQTEHGAPAAGACAEVEYYSGNIITKISTEEPYKCNTNTFTNKVYGTITSFPAGLYGSWVIDGNSSYNAGSGTKFSQDNGVFANGACVKIKYYTQNGIHHATEIETESSDGCSGGTPSLPGNNIKLFAAIDSFPAGPFTGGWSIGGVTFNATGSTEFEQDNGAFANGVCVKAKYAAGSAEPYTLISVETENDYKCDQSKVDPTTLYKSYGFVEVIPAATLTGTWQVSGVSYLADNSTKFKQEYGFFAVGAYVEVKYTISGTTKTAAGIKTHVAPGSGQNIIAGILDGLPDDEWDDWVVDGKTYTAAPAISVGKSPGALSTTGMRASAAPLQGEYVIITSYRSNGVDYIITADRGLPTYLPLISK